MKKYFGILLILIALLPVCFGCVDSQRKPSDQNFACTTRNPNAAPTSTPDAKIYKGTAVDYANTTQYLKWKQMIDSLIEGSSDGRLTYNSSVQLFQALYHFRVDDTPSCFTSAFHGKLPAYNSTEPTCIGSYFWRDIEIRLLYAPVREIILVQGEAAVCLPVSEALYSLLSKLSDPAYKEDVENYALDGQYSIRITYALEDGQFTLSQESSQGELVSVVFSE